MIKKEEIRTFGNDYKNSRVEIKTKKISEFYLTEMDFTGHNIMNVSLLHNGSKNGNAGNGPIVKIKFKNNGCTQMFLNGCETEEFVIEFNRISERNQLITALEMIVNELKK